MGSGCAKEVTLRESPIIPEGIAELKKQRQFSEEWKRRFDVTLNCYFTTISRLCGKSAPYIRGCKGVIVVKLWIINKDPKYSKLNSILHMPVLQWHGIDIKLQFPKFLPLNMWEGDFTTFALYHPEDSTNRGFCTVTGKIGQEQILIEEELRFGKPVPTEEWKTLSKKLESQLLKYQASTKKKNRTSHERGSAKESHDTGYTSEQQPPYPTLRYSERDTDSDLEFEEQKQTEKRSKMRRKDTPSFYGRPFIKSSLKSCNIPLIEELEMNQESSDELSDPDTARVAGSENPSRKVSEKSGEANVGSLGAARVVSRRFSGSGKRKYSTRSCRVRTPLQSENAGQKRKSRSLVDFHNTTDPDNSAHSGNASGESNEMLGNKPVPRRKKKSLTTRLLRDRTLLEGTDNTKNTDEAKQLKQEFNSAEDADDEDDLVKNAPGDTNVQQPQERLLVTDNDDKNIESADKIIAPVEDNTEPKDCDDNKALEETLIIGEQDDKTVSEENIDGCYSEPLTHLLGDKDCSGDITVALQDNHETGEVLLDKKNDDVKEYVQAHVQAVKDKETDISKDFEAKTSESRIDTPSMNAQKDNEEKLDNTTKNGENDKDIIVQGTCTTSVFELNQSNDFSMRSKAESFSVKERKPQTPRKTRSLCVSGMDLNKCDIQGTSSETAPPLSPIKSFCE